MNISPFNNSIETGIRILCILHEAHPKSFDLQTLIYLDYITIHSRDFGSQIESLHPELPYRTGEVYVKRALIKDGIDLFCTKNLIDVLYLPDGIQYAASEEATPFIESLQETYITELLKRTKWLVNSFKIFEKKHLQDLFDSKLEKINNEFNIGILK